MTKYARFDGNVVSETFAELPVFPPELMLEIDQVPDEVEQNWTFDGVTFSPPPSIPPDYTKPAPPPVGMTADQLVQVLLDKGLISTADLTEALNG